MNVIILTLDSLCPSAVLKCMDPAEASGPCKAVCLCFDLHLRDASREEPFGGKDWRTEQKWVSDGPITSVALFGFCRGGEVWHWRAPGWFLRRAPCLT